MVYTYRLLEDFVKRTVKTRPLLYLNGPRQCGKSTLAQNIPIGKRINYVTFDNPVHLSFARNDPTGFLQKLPRNKLNVIDEVQLAPELFRNFKIAVDEKRLAGENRALYVLTG